MDVGNMHLSSVSIAHWLQIAVVAILIFVVGRWVARFLSRMLFKAMSAQKVDETIAHFVKSILYYILLVAVVLAALSHVGFNVTSLLAVLGAAGLAVGLALKDSLSNFASGVMIILMRFFKVGDVVSAAGQTGKVKRVHIFFTELVTGDNQKIIIPNSQILGGVITNATGVETRRIDLVMGIGYSDDIDKARNVILEQLKDPRVLAEPAPQVAVAELADSSVNFVVRPWVKTEDYWAVRFDLTEKIKKAFDEAGISIPFPQQDVHLFKEN